MKLIVLGAPGAGKGTQAHFVSLHYGIAHISTGELLRAEMKAGTETGIQITGLMERGMLVPDETVINVLCKRLNDKDCNNGFLLDGFPRTLSQAKETESVAGKIDNVFEVHVDDSIIVSRMSGRRICPSCGATYHLVYKPPLNAGACDACGSPLMQRVDDKSFTVRNRLSIYHKETKPVMEYFKHQNKLIVVDGTKEIEEVTKMIIKAIG